MPHVDYDKIFVQLHAVGRSLKLQNQDLRRRCAEMEARFGAPPFGLYNRYVNQVLIKRAKHYGWKLSQALAPWKRVFGNGRGQRRG